MGDKATEVDVLQWMGRLALELVGQGGLGYSFDPLVENTRNPYGEALKDYLCVSCCVSFPQLLMPFI